MNDVILVQGGGDLASGVIIRLVRVGFRVLVTELPKPSMVRRAVSFGEAVFGGETTVEGITSRLIQKPAETLSVIEAGEIPVLVDPEGEFLAISMGLVDINFPVRIDARMLKRPTPARISDHRLVIGLGPGNRPGDNCHAVVETKRGHTLGRVYWQGSVSEDTGQPDGDPRRVLRSPAAGHLSPAAEIGDFVEEGEEIGKVDGQPVEAPFAGVLRGLIHPEVRLHAGMKIGDVDPRGQLDNCFLISDKALAIGGGVLEAIFSSPGLIKTHWRV